MVQSDHPLIHPWIPLLKIHKKSLINYICNKTRKKRGPKFINDLITFFFFNILYIALLLTLFKN